MKRLKLLITVFSLAVSLPLAYVVYQTYTRLEQEERAQMHYFAETMFDQMEAELAVLIQEEERREVDEYGYFRAGVSSDGKQPVSPLADGNYASFIYGYLQNNPDGSFQTPLIADMGRVPPELQKKVVGIKEVNQAFNAKKISLSSSFSQPGDDKEVEKEEISTKADGAAPRNKKISLAERYLKRAPAKSTSQGYLGKKQQRVENISREQAYTIASEREALATFSQQQTRLKISPPPAQSTVSAGRASSERRSPLEEESLRKAAPEMAAQLPGDPVAVAKQSLQVEVAPFQSVIINTDKVYVFRRMGVDGQLYRQGFIVLSQPFMEHLVAHHFTNQPLSQFSQLKMSVSGSSGKGSILRAGAPVDAPTFAVARQFPKPFDFLALTLTADQVPASSARSSLNLAIVFLSVFMLIGLLVIYRSVNSIVAMSERRSDFVSSITHELKTPLTNIRMYIEMLEQGVASSPEKKQEYLGVLTRESSRLSILINNVLELARLEKKTRQFNMQYNSITSVFSEVMSAMEHNLNQEGFQLHIPAAEVEEFVFDREVIVQILMNLIENSMKFGKDSAVKQITLGAEARPGMVDITVSDTGPGIPKNELTKIFDDFYRVDNSLTKNTGGTGIGLALVKKFVVAMGGRVAAANNTDAGCTITISLPSSLGN
ncbi:MAG: hypothetical protein CSB34_04445 [Desulfobulbus propionicus]|nr:MAG: hypothetical protein CSB34_04445 [Desulfobulbus propionicus]